MNQQDAEEYTQSLGQIVAGSWRQIALAKRLGVPKALGLEVDQWVNDRLGGYIQRSIPERRKIVADATAEGYSTRQIEEFIGVDHATVARDVVANATPEPIDAMAALWADEQIRKTAHIAEKRQANEDKRKADLERPVTVALAPGLYHGDFRELSEQIANDSVDLVFTDPPYDGKSVDLYGDAARVAKRILKPGASFVAYSGQSHLPEILSKCSVYLQYWWTIAGVHGGGNQILNKLGVRCGWKPLVWFVKGTRGDVQNILLDTIKGDREKDEHEWQQSEEEAYYYIEKLTTSDGLVVDFFVGGGTTMTAAKRLGRKWIGFEVNASSIERASKRINEAAA